MSDTTIEQIADGGTSVEVPEPVFGDEQLVAMLVDRARSGPAADR
ncbi:MULTISPECIES: hypothetical protein [unclassified Streptomyces]|nr:MULTISPECIES: hypothetical protein [unclassified Streptomyces]SCE34344.1 hypothetical protein GA0115241_1133231 [Streptomyces sp. DpondAA-D4]